MRAHDDVPVGGVVDSPTVLDVEGTIDFTRRVGSFQFVYFPDVAGVRASASEVWREPTQGLEPLRHDVRGAHHQRVAVEVVR